MNHLNFASPQDALEGKRFYEKAIRDAEKRTRAELLASVPKPLPVPLFVGLPDERDFYRLAKLNSQLEDFHRSQLDLTKDLAPSTEGTLKGERNG